MKRPHQSISFKLVPQAKYYLFAQTSVLYVLVMICVTAKRPSVDPSPCSNAKNCWVASKDTTGTTANLSRLGSLTCLKVASRTGATPRAPRCTPRSARYQEPNNRVLGTPDYLAPELLMGIGHGECCIERSTLTRNRMRGRHLVSWCLRLRIHLRHSAFQ